MFRHVIFYFLTIGFVFNAFRAESQVPSSEILNDLNKLKTLGTVMYIAAHPDDENTRLLSYLANERHVRTVYLSLTRGDGGQNLIGGEQGDMLGVIRTEELLAARRTDGAEQWFTRAVDFGYSKNPDETFAHWDKRTILADVVYAIRKFRPDVIICRFPSTGEGGHGHHTASAILAQEAFDLAADPNAYPEQLGLVSVWQSKSLFWNTFNFGGNNTTSPDQIKLDVGAYNALLGKSYGEIAANSRSNHKSQGFGSAAQRGSNFEYFKYIKGEPVVSDILEGIELGWSRFKILSKYEKTIEGIIEKFNPSHPEKSVKVLVNLYSSLKALNADKAASHYINLKIKAIESLIIKCSGIWMETLSRDLVLVPSGSGRLTAQFLLRNPANARLKKITLLDQDTIFSRGAAVNQMLKFSRGVAVPSNMYHSDPYWLRAPSEHDFHYVRDYNYLGLPQGPEALYTKYTCEIEGVEFNFDVPVSYKITDPVKGEYYIPLEVLPPVTITPQSKVLLVGDYSEQSLFFLVKSNIDDFKGELVVMEMQGVETKVIQPQIQLKKNNEILVEVRVKIHDMVNADLKVWLNVDGDRYDKGIQRIEYDHIPHRFILKTAQVRIVKTDIKTGGKRIGYIEGAGDDVSECLKGIGYSVTELSVEQLMNTDLSTFDAIVCGVRAFNTNEQLIICHDKLMQYVANGGRLVVQYNTNSRVGPISAGIGPYKFGISRNRVTEEQAEVRFINDTSRLLNHPNKISNKDFEGWIQERGIYFATDLDSNYQTLFLMHDTGEKDLDGSLIYARYGKGLFVYSGLAFFRELPAGVPGAYRLFVNLISN